MIILKDTQVIVILIKLRQTVIIYLLSHRNESCNQGCCSYGNLCWGKGVCYLRGNFISITSANMFNYTCYSYIYMYLLYVWYVMYM